MNKGMSSKSTRENVVKGKRNIDPEHNEFQVWILRSATGTASLGLPPEFRLEFEEVCECVGQRLEGLLL